MREQPRFGMALMEDRKRLEQLWKALARRPASIPVNRTNQERVRLKAQPLLRLQLPPHVIGLEQTRLDTMWDVVMIQTGLSKEPVGVLAVGDRMIGAAEPVENLRRNRVMINWRIRYPEKAPVSVVF